MYETVEQQVLVSPGTHYCTQILCDVNATAEEISGPRALQTAGFYSGPIDGVLGPNTMPAITAYQQSKGLAADDYLSVETVRVLGVFPQ